MDATWSLALTVAAFAALTDARTGHIPNWLTGTALVAAVVFHGAFGIATGGLAEGARAVGWAVVGAAACGALPAYLFARGAMGGGDVKLLVALGAICHPMRGFAVLTYGFAFAALVAAGQLVYRGELLGTAARAAALVVRRPKAGAPREPTPPALTSWFRLGPSILVGVVLAWRLYR